MDRNAIEEALYTLERFYDISQTGWFEENFDQDEYSEIEFDAHYALYDLRVMLMKDGYVPHAHHDFNYEDYLALLEAHDISPANLTFHPDAPKPPTIIFVYTGE